MNSISNSRSAPQNSPSRTLMHHSTQRSGECTTCTFQPFAKEELEQSIPARFERMAAMYPRRLAVKVKKDELSYEELNRAANRVARVVLDLVGRKPEPVALVFEQGMAILVAMLGVWKAGKISVPLDPWVPEARLRSMLTNSAAVLILTRTRNLKAAMELDRSVPCISIDELDPGVSEENLGLDISPESLSTILFTSGSTGEPKGVFHNHRSWLKDTMVHTNDFHIRAEDRMTLLGFPATSSLFKDLLDPILNGAAIFPFDLREDGLANLPLYLADEKITVYHSVASVFRHFAARLADGQAFSDLRLLEISGEPVTRRDLELYQTRFAPECVFTCRMGITEAGTVFRCFFDKESSTPGHIVPVGYPVEESEILLLDEAGKAVAPGEIGEIAVRGEYISPGYWRRPDLTRKVFFPDPDGGTKRIYLTGDLGRMAPEGYFEHLGRKDLQVNIRGQRVETAEIEVILLDHDAIREAAVAVHHDASGDAWLAAYVVPAQEPPPEARELRDFLNGRMPQYMVPSAFVVLASLPLTPSGKLDRQALPVPGQGSDSLAGEFIAPRDPTEEVVAGILAEAIGIERVSVQHNFFELGGHSLLATQAISRLRTAFEVELTLREFFATPTVAGLAASIDKLLRAGKNSTTPPLQPVPRDDDLPLSFSQERMWFLDQLEPGSSAYNIYTVLAIRGPLNVAALQRSLAEIVQRHEALRTVFGYRGGLPTQIVRDTVTFTLATVDLNGLPVAQQDTEVARVTTLESLRPFDLSQGPLFRASLIEKGRTNYILVLNMHQIICDGWSSGVLFRELGMLYEAFATGNSCPLPPLAIQYADFAHWQRQWLRGETLEPHLSYWRKQLAGLSSLQLPTDRPPASQQEFRAAKQSAMLPGTLTEALVALSRQEDVTLFMTLLAAFKVLLHRYTGQDKISVGTIVASRNRAEIEGLMGLFLNNLVLYTDVSENPSFREFLRRVRGVTVGAYTHQDLPFEKLVEELQPKRDLNRMPLFQVMFVLEVPRKPLAVKGLDITRLASDHGRSDVDLGLWTEVMDGGLYACLEYNSDLFYPSTIRRMLQHFHFVLKEVAVNPDLRLLDIPLDEQKQEQKPNSYVPDDDFAF